MSLSRPNLWSHSVTSGIGPICKTSSLHACSIRHTAQLIGDGAAGQSPWLRGPPICRATTCQRRKRQIGGVVPPSQACGRRAARRLPLGLVLLAARMPSISVPAHAQAPQSPGNNDGSKHLRIQLRAHWQHSSRCCIKAVTVANLRPQTQLAATSAQCIFSHLRQQKPIAPSATSNLKLARVCEPPSIKSKISALSCGEVIVLENTTPASPPFSTAHLLKWWNFATRLSCFFFSLLHFHLRTSNTINRNSAKRDCQR